MARFRKVVVLTGAGISAESGIPVFRSETGLWEQERIEDVCVPEALIRNPKKVHDFYNKMRLTLRDKKPNEAHYALSRLQQEGQDLGIETVIITQNIDDLHEKAGSSGVLHMHGFLRSAWCTSCDRRYPWEDDTSPELKCKFCNHNSVRPDIVFFGEMPYHMEQINAHLITCDLFAAIGTSGVVYPAAGFAMTASSSGALAVEFNLEPSYVKSSFQKACYGKASVTVPAFVDRLLGGEEPV